jgi:hypothetical protein
MLVTWNVLNSILSVLISFKNRFLSFSTLIDSLSVIQSNSFFKRLNFSDTKISCIKSTSIYRTFLEDPHQLIETIAYHPKKLENFSILLEPFISIEITSKNASRIPFISALKETFFSLANNSSLSFSSCIFLS